MRKQMQTLSFLLALVALTAVVPSAEAGRGSSTSAILSAIRSGSVDAIVTELERAEFLVCGECVEPVLALLDHPDYRVREVAAWWIARRPILATEVHDLSIARLYGDDPTAARNAADALGSLRRPDAIPALAYAAGRQELPAETRRAAVQALGLIASPSVQPAIVAAMADPAAEVRLEAVRAYRDLRADRTGEPAAALLGDADALVRREAAAVVGVFAWAGARLALEQLLASDPDALARRNAAWALGRIGDPASRPALDAASRNDPSSLVRSVAAASYRGL